MVNTTDPLRKSAELGTYVALTSAGLINEPVPEVDHITDEKFTAVAFPRV